MKSKITIDVDWDNVPVIKIEYNHSEDVRDTLVKRFLEGFGGDSCWAKFRYVETAPTVEANKTSIIRAITLPECSEQAKLMIAWEEKVVDHLRSLGINEKVEEKFA